MVSLIAAKTCILIRSYLKESLQPPDLENAFSNKHSKLKDAPPFDASVGALGCISMRSLAHDDIGLLILNLG